jgi:hypothetical protein
LFSVRSDRQFCEQLEYNLLFRWFLDMDLDEVSFDASTFSRNRERLIRHEVAERFLAAIVDLVVPLPTATPSAERLWRCWGSFLARAANSRCRQGLRHHRLGR